MSEITININKMKKDIDALAPGQRYHYYTGKSMWLYENPGLQYWFATLQESGKYIFTQRKVAELSDTGIFEYYIALAKTPRPVEDSRTISNLRRTLRVS